MKPLLFIGVIGVLITAPAPQDDKAVKQEFEKLQGTWTAIAAERNGKQVAEEEVKTAHIRLVIKGDKYTLKTAQNEKGTEGAIKIDPSKKPKTIDMSRADSDRVLMGIYEVEGDILKICYGPERPTELKTKPDSDQRMHVYKKQKP